MDQDQSAGKLRLEMDLKREICEVIVTDQILASKDSRTEGPDLVQFSKCGLWRYFRWTSKVLASSNMDQIQSAGKFRLEMDLKREICEVIATGRILVSKEPSTDRPGLISKCRFI